MCGSMNGRVDAATNIRQCHPPGFDRATQYSRPLAFGQDMHGPIRLTANYYCRLQTAFKPFYEPAERIGASVTSHSPALMPPSLLHALPFFRFLLR